MTENSNDVKRVCPCDPETCKCKEKGCDCGRLDKETAMQVAEFTHREMGVE